MQAESYKQRQHDIFLRQLLDIGSLLLLCGAEVSRVEDTLMRMGRTYGAYKVNVFVITSSIIVTMEFPDGIETTQTCRIVETGAIDFVRLEALNNLSREYCNQPYDSHELKKRVAEIRKSICKSKYFFFAGNALAAGSFAIFFGGSLLDGAFAMVFGLAIGILVMRFAKYMPNSVVFNLLCSFVIGVGIVEISRLFPLLQADKIMIGDIMLLIPGLALTNSVRDILIGDTISGILRLTESLVWAGAIAAGFMLALYLGRI